MGWRYLETGEILNDIDFSSFDESSSIASRPKTVEDIEYKVVAVVSIPISLNYRFYRNEQFVLSSEQFIRDTGTSAPMYYTFDMVDDEASKKNGEFYCRLYRKYRLKPEL